MESLFRLTELESRIPLNMNVLVKGRCRRCSGSPSACANGSTICATCWCGAPTTARADRAPAGSARRLPDRLSEPRQGDQDHPHRGRAEALIKAFKLTDVQADAILNMRLRACASSRKMEIRTEDKKLARERRGSRSCSAPSRAVEGRRAGPESARHVSGRRRRSASAAPFRRRARARSRRDRGGFGRARAVTVVVSEKGWMRALKGHVADLSGLAFKTDDKLEIRVLRRDHLEAAVRHQRPLLHARRRKSCRAGAAMASRSGMFIDMEQDAAIVSLFVNKGGRKFLVASHEGRALSSRGRLRRQHPQGQAGAQRRDAERGARDRDR
jgi:topoisomerase-4 subunit A